MPRETKADRQVRIIKALTHQVNDLNRRRNNMRVDLRRNREALVEAHEHQTHLEARIAHLTETNARLSKAVTKTASWGGWDIADLIDEGYLHEGDITQ